MKANIKESNYWAIKDFAQRPNGGRITGTKLQALYALIQKKGEPIKSKYPSVSGVKSLEYADGQFIAIKRTGPSQSFFPCALKVIQLVKL